MTEKRKIILSGELGKRFGRFHFFAVITPAEAIRALVANFPDFISYMEQSNANGVAYRVHVDKDPLAALEAVHDPFSQTFRISPVISGAKGGFGIVLGIGLIAASFFLPGAALFTLGSFAPSLASISFGIGTSMLLGSVSSMLAPHPKAAKPSEQPNNLPSYSFNGAVNTESQGQPVAIGYGRLICGSGVASAALIADEYQSGALT